MESLEAKRSILRTILNFASQSSTSKSYNKLTLKKADANCYDEDLGGPGGIRSIFLL